MLYTFHQRQITHFVTMARWNPIYDKKNHKNLQICMCMHVYIFVCMHVLAYVCVCMGGCVCVCVCVSECVCVCVCVCVCMCWRAFVLEGIIIISFVVCLYTSALFRTKMSQHNN